MARKTFDEELAELKASVTEMADLAKWMFETGVQSLIDLDTELANDVLEKRHRLADLDEQIEEDALKLVARQQPMAKDMRAIGAALKLITYINRIGRYGKDIAQVTVQWDSDTHHADLVNLPRMVELVHQGLNHVLHAYHEEEDVDLDQLMEWEDELDALRWSIFRECLTYMAQDPEHIEEYAYYMMIARYLERCGDNVCKMAEKIHYMVEGEHLAIDT
jgi:phosphate transport system protein